MIEKVHQIALVGQPNSGKTSLFNKLTGSTQRVGNWPGVTVEKKEGKFLLAENKVNLVDLPGIYSLSTYSLEEKITRNFLKDNKPELIINIVDASHLERQLFLTIQLLLLNIPTILVLNMMDDVADKGLKMDSRRLEELLGIPVVEAVAREGTGTDILLEQIKKKIQNPLEQKNENKLLIEHSDFYHHLEKTAGIIAGNKEFSDYSFWYAVKFFEDDSIVEKILKKDKKIFSEISTIKDTVFGGGEEHHEQLVHDWLYSIAKGIEKEVLYEDFATKPGKKIINNFLDLVFINKHLGVPIFLFVMFVMFIATFFLGDIITAYLETGLNYIGTLVELIDNPVVVSLVNDGILSGVGNVLLLIPYIFIMFFLLTLLEDSGYMARAAFVMDRFMHKLGLHGKSFIPLLMGFGCNVPAIMASRSLDSHHERLKTILMIPFVPCSARLPVFVLFAAAFWGRLGGAIVVFILYVFGITISILTGLLLNKTVIKKKTEGLIMELPSYRVPHLSNALVSTWPKVKEYIIKAGTIIFGFSILLWILSYFPAGAEFGGENSIIGMMGKGIGILLKPLGFDWKMSVGLVTGFFAKEIVISSLSVLYSGSDSLAAALPNIMNPVVAFSYLSFILIYVPCVGAVSVMKTETGSWKWTLLSVVYSISLAWAVSFLITRIGLLLIPGL